MAQGWVKLHRKTLDDPTLMKDTEHLAVWIYLLLHAAHGPYSVEFNRQCIRLQPGQLITGRRAVASALGISESKVTRILDRFRRNRLIDQVCCSQNRLITLLAWEANGTAYPDELPPDSHRTAAGQPSDTIKKDKKENKEKKAVDYLSVLAMYHEICVSLPKVQALSQARKTAIDRITRLYSPQQLRQAFSLAQSSPFLKGEQGGWKANFDWLMQEGNLLKVLEGNYAGISKNPTPPKRTLDADEQAAIARMLLEDMPDGQENAIEKEEIHG